MLRDLDANNQLRGALVARYRERLDAVDGVVVPFGDRPETERSAHHLAVALLPPSTDRGAVAAALREAGIQTSLHYPPTHSFSAYTAARADAAVTDALAGRLLTLPLFPHLEPGQVDLVCDALAAALPSEAS